MCLLPHQVDTYFVRSNYYKNHIKYAALLAACKQKACH